MPHIRATSINAFILSPFIFAVAVLLLATQCLSLLVLFFAIASHVAAVRCLCLSKLRLASIAFAMRYFSTPLFYVAFLRCAIASPFNSLPCSCDSLLLHALPLCHVSKPCHSHAVISNSELFRCGANHVVSMQFHCVSVQSFALPLMRGSNPQLAIASPFIEKLCHCDQFRISYENFPRPLLRHCPMPRRAP